MSEFRIVDQDDLTPMEIEHKCEEMFDGDVLSQRYNYVIYHFDCAGGYFWARAYLGEMDTVSVYGPFDSRAGRKTRPGPLDDYLLGYMRRRFRRIQVLGSEGYVTVWSR